MEREAAQRSRCDRHGCSWLGSGGRSVEAEGRGRRSRGGQREPYASTEVAHGLLNSGPTEQWM
jgi:hypothetical protein